MEGDEHRMGVGTGSFFLLLQRVFLFCFSSRRVQGGVVGYDDDTCSIFYHTHRVRRGWGRDPAKGVSGEYVTCYICMYMLCLRIFPDASGDLCIYVTTYIHVVCMYFRVGVFGCDTTNNCVCKQLLNYSYTCTGEKILQKGFLCSLPNTQTPHLSLCDSPSTTYARV